MLLGDIIQKLWGFYTKWGMLSRNFQYNHPMLDRYTETFRIMLSYAAWIIGRGVLENYLPIFNLKHYCFIVCRIIL